MRRRFSDDFKARVTIKKEKTHPVTCWKFQAPPNQISGWQKQLLENVGTVYERKHTQEKSLSRPRRNRNPGGTPPREGFSDCL